MTNLVSIGDSFLYQGDCIKVLDAIKSNYVDLVLTDPPYGTTACKWDSVISMECMWPRIMRASKPNAAFVFTASQPFSSILGASNISMLQYSWYWQKSRATGHLNAKRRPLKNVEDILVFYGDQPTYNPQGLTKIQKVVKNSKSNMARGVTTDSTSTVTGGITREEYTKEYTNYPRQILEFPSEGFTVHPTQKPVALMEYLIRTYTNEGDTILDFTMGSGTTGVACVNTGRRFVGVEKDPYYFQIAVDRITKAYAINPTLI
jgi:DNA modification methylase